MEKEFVPYELAVKLKELGFNEPCFGYYDVDEGYSIGYAFCYSDRELQPEIGCSAPLYQQAFRWFRERYNAVCEIIRREDKNHSTFMGWVYIDNRKIDVVSYWEFKTYEASELACLDKLIELTFKSE